MPEEGRKRRREEGRVGGEEMDLWGPALCPGRRRDGGREEGGRRGGDGTCGAPPWAPAAGGTEGEVGLGRWRDMGGGTEGGERRDLWPIEPTKPTFPILIVID